MENDKQKRAAIIGATSMAILWGVFVMADAIDEFVFDTSTAIGIFIVIAAPIVSLIVYIIHYIKNKYSIRSVFSMIGAYVFAAIVLALAMIALMSGDRFPIEQKSRGFMDLNGIEYFAFAIFVPVITLVGVGIFHLIYAIILKCKRKNTVVSTSNAVVTESQKTIVKPKTADEAWLDGDDIED